MNEPTEEELVLLIKLKLYSVRLNLFDITV